MSQLLILLLTLLLLLPLPLLLLLLLLLALPLLLPLLLLLFVDWCMISTVSNDHIKIRTYFSIIVQGVAYQPLRQRLG